MIASLRGAVTAISGSSIVIEVGGVGLALRPSANVLSKARIGQDISVATYLVVRQDELTLFGFVDETERFVFEVLQRVSGVGPRTAMQAISALGASQIQRAIADQDVKVLTQAPGIGAKVAQRIMLELANAFVAAPVDSTRESADGWSSVQAALINLGWPEREAREAVAMARHQDETLQARSPEQAQSPEQITPVGEASLSERLKLALSYLGRK